MDILHEIIETADNIMSELEETDFMNNIFFVTHSNFVEN